MKGGHNAVHPAIRELEGRPGHAPLPVELPCDEASLEPPQWLLADEVAVGFWNRNAPILQRMGTLKAADTDRFAAVATAWSQFRSEHGLKKVAWFKALMGGMSEFGMSPMSRTRIKLDGNTKPKSKLNDFVSKRKQPGTSGNLRVVPPDGAERAAN